MFRLAILVILLINFSIIDGCGCYGAGSCNTNSEFAFCTLEGVCDCCAVCNTCNQLLSGCANINTQYDAYFSPPLPATFEINQDIGNYIIMTSSTDQVLWDPPCFQPNLPNGLSFQVNSQNQLYLSGTPTEIFPSTQYLLKAKGDAEVITGLVFTISVTQRNNSECESHTSDVCTYRFMRCVTDDSYQTCNLNALGVTFWDNVQHCRTGATCHPSGNYVYCY
jgi:hypothetical protein